MTNRDVLLAALSPDLVAGIENLITERVREELEAAGEQCSSPWHSLEEAADYLRVSPRTVERQLARGRLRSQTIGRRRLLHRDDLDALARAATREVVTPATPPRRRAATVDHLAGSA